MTGMTLIKFSVEFSEENQAKDLISRRRISLRKYLSKIDEWLQVHSQGLVGKVVCMEPKERFLIEFRCVTLV